ncbi:MAG TPA: hypothetical protein VK031_02720 [Tissierellaceae bacterium]|nr:hypothetical protein [Tissierellaceae bacterium]
MRNEWIRKATDRLSRMPEEAKEVRETALTDLYFFARLVNPGYVYGEIHKEVFKWISEYSLFGQGEGLSSNKLIMLPRAHLKSHCVATWVAWIITRHPEVTILYVSATSELAETQLFSIQNILASDVYQRYFPEYINPQEGKRERWSQRRFSIDHAKRRQEGIRDPTVATAGLTTNTTGWHADIVVADDLVVPENAYTQEGRDSVMKKSSQFSSIRNAGGFTLACGTRYHPSDVYALWKEQAYDIYDESGETVDRVPVWEVKEHTVETDGVFLWPRTVRASDGKFFGFDRQTLSRIEAEYEDRTQFFAQYYNNPNESGSNRISPSCFQYYTPKFIKRKSGNWYFKDKRLNVYASIDFAFSLRKRADYSAIVVIGIDPESNIYVLDIDRFKTDKISEYYDRIVKLHSRWDFKKLRAETTAAQVIIVRDLKDRMRDRGLSLPIEEYRPNRSEGSKEERIAAALEPKYEDMKMWHFEGGLTPLLEEELLLSRPPHDDMKDALAAVVSIAVRPRDRRSMDGARDNRVVFNSRFGGVAFRG